MSLTVTVLCVGKHYIIRTLKRVSDQALYNLDLGTIYSSLGVSFPEKEVMVVIRSETEWNKQPF
jgi:hypothetical protein